MTLPMVDYRSPQEAALRFPLRLTRLGLPLVALTLAAGCSTSASFEARDGSGLFPTARITYACNPSENAEADPIHTDKGHRWVAEVDGTYADEDFDGVSFQLSEVTVGGRIHWRAEEDYQVNLLLGGAFADATLETDGGAASTDFDGSNVGPYLGLDLRYFTSDRVTVYGRAQNSFLFSDATSLRGEIGTEIQLAGPVNLLLGYRWWRYVYDKNDLISSSADDELNLRGVVAGLSINL